MERLGVKLKSLDVPQLKACRVDNAKPSQLPAPSITKTCASW